MDKTPLPAHINFLTAGMGGVTGWCIVHPLNTAAVRMNLAMSSSLPVPSFSVFVSRTIKEKGFMSLYDGLSAGILRQVFYTTSRFGLYEVFRDEMAKYRPTDFFSRMLTGCISGGIAALISCPAEVTLVRISNDASLPDHARRNYKGVMDAFLRITREEGPKAFFSGSSPFINRAMVVGAVQIGTYDQFREMFKGYGIKHELTNVFCASMVSGLIFAVTTAPLETVKNRMAFQRPDPTTGAKLYTSTLQTLTTIVRKEGAMSLFSGFAPYYLRCGGQTIFMLVSLEYFRNAFKKHFV